MWHDLASRLMPNGRIMVNCAGIEEEKVVTNEKPQLVLGDSVWMLNHTIKVMSEAFPGQVSNAFHLQSFCYFLVLNGILDAGLLEEDARCRRSQLCSINGRST